MILRDQRVWLGGLDLTAHMNAIALELGAETVDPTVFGSKTRRTVPSLQTVQAEYEGLWSSALDQGLWDAIGDDKVLTTVLSGDGEAGDVAYSVPGHLATFENRGRVGNLHEVSISVRASGDEVRAVRGTVLAVESDLGAGTEESDGQVLGVVASGQRLYAALHVLDGGLLAGTLDVVVQSENITPAGWTDRIIFPQVNAATNRRIGYWRSLAGPRSETTYRVQATVAGATSFEVAVVAGII